MIIPVNIQIYYFISTIITGLVVGVMFDIYRVIRGLNSPNKIMTAISDILFWILAAVTTFVVFLYTNNGDIRYYTFVGLLLGLYIYFKLISRRFINVLSSLVYFVFKFFRLLIIFIVYPIKILRYYSKYSVYKLREYGAKGYKASSQKIKKFNEKIAKTKGKTPSIKNSKKKDNKKEKGK